MMLYSDLAVAVGRSCKFDGVVEAEVPVEKLEKQER